MHLDRSNQRLGKIEMDYDLFDRRDLNERAIVQYHRKKKFNELNIIVHYVDIMVYVIVSQFYEKSM